MTSSLRRLIALRGLGKNFKASEVKTCLGEVSQHLRRTRFSQSLQCEDSRVTSGIVVVTFVVIEVLDRRKLPNSI